MPRALRSSTLQTRTSRAKLAQRPKPHWFSVAPGIALGYRRNAGPGSWSVRSADGKGSNWIKTIALADDQENSNGKTIMTFSEACDRAKALARGRETDSSRPATIDEALKDYANDLAVRGGGATNAMTPRKHLTPSLLATPVAMLRARELKRWRDELTKVMKASSANRICKNVKAALNLAAAHDERIVNRNAWTIGLAALPEADDTESNLVLTDQQVRDVIAAAYSISDEFGIYVEVHAATGARSGQIAELNVGDLVLGTLPNTKGLIGSVPTRPVLMMPSSLKGKGRRTRTRKPMPISVELAMRLKAATIINDNIINYRAASEPLLSRNGQRWNSLAHRSSFQRAARAAGLPDGASMYCLRHTVITRLLLASVPVRLVASSLDTSVAMIEKTYSKHISNFGDDLMRAALVDPVLTAPVALDRADKIVALRRR